MRRNAILFLVVALAQLAAPVWMMRQHERVLSDGDVFKFRTAPIDPRDPFRGEYVTLNYDASTGTWEAPVTSTVPEDAFNSGEQLAYALLGEDSAGFANVVRLVNEVPTDGAYVLVSYWNYDNDSIVERIAFTFDRFYLEEGDGAKTEALLQPQWNDGEMSQPLPAYALVHVYKGDAVIEDLIVGDKSIHEWLEASPEEAATWQAQFPVTVDTTQVVEDSVIMMAAPEAP